MKTNLTHLVKLIIFFSLTNSVFSQNNYKRTIAEIETLISDKYFEKSLIAIDVYDLTAEEIVFKKNERQLLHPASNQKIITTAAALLFLEDNFSFKTSLYYSDEIIDSICTGNLFVVGGGDPDFTSSDLDSIIIEMKNIGIKKIEGNIYGDISYLDSLYWGKGWMWDDEPYNDFPHFTPLIINDSGVKFIISPGILGGPAKIFLEPKSEFYSFANLSITTETDSSTLKIERDWVNGNNDYTAIGEISQAEEVDTVIRNLVDPYKYFLTLFKEKLTKHGITISGVIDTMTLPQKIKHVKTIERSFGEILDNLNKESDNLSSEMTLRALAYTNSGSPAIVDSGLILVDSLISMIGLDPSVYRIVDGSGVSHYNLVTTELLNEILIFFYYNEKDSFQKLYNSFPIAGVDGTLEKRMKEGLTFENVHAKTGTLSGVSSLSGYLNTKNGNLISFSIIIQNYVGKDMFARNYIDRICEILCRID